MSGTTDDSHIVAMRDSPPNSDARLDTLKDLADQLLATYHTSHSVADLEKAIGMYEEALLQQPTEHERRTEFLSDLGDALCEFCFNHEADDTRINRCVELHREALRLRPPGHPLRDHSLHKLARSLSSVLYHQTGSLDILRESASLNREALLLRPLGHPERVKSINNLAIDLSRIVEDTGDIEIQAEIVNMYREVLRMRPPGHPMRHITLNNLGSALYSSFEIVGGSDILAEAISVTREAMELRPMGHPQRFTVLDNLASALSLRSNYEGHSESLSEAIVLIREALQVLPFNHPERARIMSNLADSLHNSFRYNGDGNALAEAISLLREAMTLKSPGSHSHVDALNNLAELLEAKFDDDSDHRALSEAASLYREALHLRPIGHYLRFWSLEGLARVLCKVGAPSWEEALSCYQEALQSCPTGYPGRSRLLSGMSKCFLHPNSPFFNLIEGISCLSESCADTSHVSGRLKSAILDLRQLEVAYGSSGMGAHPDARTQDEERILKLYSQVIGLLPLAANFGLDHGARLQAVAGSDEIARNAAARALSLGSFPQAVELMELGRGVFWTQTLHLRAATFDGVPEDDGRELQRMLRLLDHGARRVESRDHSAMQREQELEKRRQLNEAIQALIIKIRGYPGLDRFLLPPAFDALFSSLPDGFVVVVNASKLGYHALLLQRATRLVTSLALKPFRAEFDCAKLRAQLPRDMEVMYQRGSKSDTRAMRVDSGRLPNFENVLSVLWISVVTPVLTVLGLQKTQGRARPRLWWCVTGELSFLPIHAAGKYRADDGDSTADYVISSYIPTLASLTKARRFWTPIVRSDLAGLIICEASTQEGSTAYLSHALDETRVIRECFASAGAQVLNQGAPHISPSELYALLTGTPAHILHMACHGIQHSNPLKSSFLLHEGNLSIEDIIQLDLPHVCLSFLSACQTAKGDHNAPDQAVHLAASMLFCGFRSVIGTMWSMCDEDGPKVARHFYESLLEEEKVDLDDIAYALDEAVQALRRSSVPASRWASFMHIGG